MFEDDDHERRNPQAKWVLKNSQSVVLPERYTDEGDYMQWQDHFGSVAAVNGWDDAAKASLVERLVDWLCADHLQATP